jgi:hypothetical protein
MLFGCSVFIDVKVLFMVSLTVSFATAFYPITVRDYAVVNEQQLLGRFNNKDWLRCIMRCQKNPKCLAYNYQYKKQRNGLCELYKCGLDQQRDPKNTLVLSHGIVFQQLQVAKVSWIRLQTHLDIE